MFHRKDVKQVTRKDLIMVLHSYDINPIPLALVHFCTAPPISYDFSWKYILRDWASKILTFSFYIWEGVLHFFGIFFYDLYAK